MPSKITVPEIRARKATRGQSEKLAMVTAYDVTFARMVDAAGVDAILVGDSLGRVIQGGTSKLPVTVDEICDHGRAVMRGTQRAHVIGDMPFMSYQLHRRSNVASSTRRPQPTPPTAAEVDPTSQYARRCPSPPGPSATLAHA